MQSSFDLLALLLALAAIFGYINHRIIHLPLTVGLLLLALFTTGILIGIGTVFPQLGLKFALRQLLATVNLPSALLNGFLSFLLFAGALEVNFKELFARKWTILALAIIGTVLSTVLVAGGLVGVSFALKVGIPFPWCLVFGALISPTDPVAVLLVLKRVGISEPLQAVIAGESLFNDGVGVVLFSLLLSLATGSGNSEHGAAMIVGEFILSAFGGGLLGLGLGFVAFLMIRGVDDYTVELIISLALVTGTYSLAGSLNVSGPVAVVVAGILIGNHGMEQAMSEATRQHLQTFWLMVDDTLNALLFLLIGIEIAAIDLNPHAMLATLVMIPVALLARWVSVIASALPLSLDVAHRFGSGVVLTWGGLRGGIAVALALGLPPGPFKDELLTIAYGIVVFSIIVQGLTLEAVARRVLPRAAIPAAAQGGASGSRLPSQRN